MRQRRATFRIPADRWSARTARRALVATLEAWGLDALRNDAELVVSELITNAVTHAAGAPSYRLRLTPRPNGLRIEVADDSPAAPAIRPIVDERPGGRGLRIVASLASQWGHHADQHGKRVWADLDLPG